MKQIIEEQAHLEDQNQSNSLECNESFSNNEESHPSISLDNSIETYENYSRSNNKGICLYKSLEQNNNTISNSNSTNNKKKKNNNNIPKTNKTIQKYPKIRTKPLTIKQIILLLSMREQYNQKRFDKFTFPYTMEEVKNILYENLFVSKKQIDEIIENFLKFQNNQLLLITNNQNSVSRNYMEILLKKNGKTLLDYQRLVKRVYFYHSIRIGECKIFQNIEHSTLQHLIEYNKECQKKNPLSSKQVKNINMAKALKIFNKK